MKTNYFVSLGFCLTLMSGCVTTNVTPLNNKHYAPVEPEEVVLYLDAADIPGVYEKIAIMYASGDHLLTNQSRMFRKVRKKASQMGANGLLLQQLKEPNTGDKVARAVLGTEADRKGELIAIYVKPPQG